MNKKNPLGHNPLNANNALRDMLRGNKNETSEEKSEVININPENKEGMNIEKLVRKTIYFSKQDPGYFR